MGCVFGSDSCCDEMVVCGLEALDMRAKTLLGHVLAVRGRCRGAK